MKARVSSLLILLSMYLMAGCATPMSAVYLPSNQQKMQSVHHWDFLAKDVAEQIKISLTDKKLLNTPIFVQPMKDTSFGEGFHNMLITSLVNNGIKTLVDKSDKALVVNYESQVVYHINKRGQKRWIGPATILAGSILVLRDAAFTTGGAVAGSVLGTAIAADYWAATQVPHTEIIITTSIASGNEYLLRKTDCYYVNDEDSYQYKTVQSKIIKVTGER